MPKHKQKETRPCYLLTRPNLREKAVWKRTPSEYSLDKLDMTFSDKKYAIEYILDQGAKENIYFLSFGKDWKNEYYVPHTTYIGALIQSKWANAYKVGKDGSLTEVLEKYEKYVRNSPELMSSLHELTGERLGCWCERVNECHAGVLIRLYKEFV